MKPVKLKLGTMLQSFQTFTEHFTKPYSLEMISSVCHFSTWPTSAGYSPRFTVPPYGQEDLQDLQSIFEIAHLRKLALFLNTQC